MPHMKSTPKGVSVFLPIRKEDSYYVDKTKFIPEVEAAARYFIFLRPMRFGKSLLVSMLETYYDLNQKDNLTSVKK